MEYAIISDRNVIELSVTVRIQLCELPVTKFYSRFAPDAIFIFYAARPGFEIAVDE